MVLYLINRINTIGNGVWPKLYLLCSWSSFFFFDLDTKQPYACPEDVNHLFLFLRYFFAMTIMNFEMVTTYFSLQFGVLILWLLLNVTITFSCHAWFDRLILLFTFLSVFLWKSRVYHFSDIIHIHNNKDNTTSE